MDGGIIAATPRRPRVAFVVQRCGEDVTGGAERLCLQHAAHMRDEWDCEILTTCARDARTWRNEYAPGRTTIAGVPARRFAVVAERDMSAFDARSRRVARGNASLEEQELWMREQGPDVPELASYLATHGESYERIFFYSYLYATTYFALPLVADRAVLVPLAHDEWMLGLSLWDSIFRSCATIACVSDDERALLKRRFPGLDVGEAVVAPGIDAPVADPAAFRKTHGIDGPYVVYLGRVEPAKGVDDLIAYFLASKDRSNGRSEATPIAGRKLVLVGPLGMTVPDHAAIVPLGTLSESDKWGALAGSEFSVIPSAYESLSLAALESWAIGKAILANGASSVLVGQCRLSNAGLWYANEREFVALLESDLLGRAKELGRNGAAYVAQRYTWDRARMALRSILDRRSFA